jgi:hypothetical protein
VIRLLLCAVIVHFEYTLEIYILLGFDHVFAIIKVLKCITLFEDGSMLLFSNNGLETIYADVLLVCVVECVVWTCLEINELAIVYVVAIGK